MQGHALAFGSVILLGVFATTPVFGGEIGHFAPGAFNIRDFVLPDPGFYWGVYNYAYRTTRANDANGDKISSRTVTGPGGQTTTVGLDVDISVYSLSPFLMWVSGKKVLGAKYGVMLNPTFSNANIDGLLSIGDRVGRRVSSGDLHIADTYVQPVWLDWTGNHYDVSYTYGFYMPTGTYQTTVVQVPLVGPVQTLSASNTGYGFWTNQSQGALYLYPWSDQRLSLESALTWEIHRKKRNLDLTPGQNLTWSWGISEYLPLSKDEKLLFEFGPTGYSSFQVSNDQGTDATNAGVRDTVHAIGVQVGVTSVRRNITANFSWLHEYSAVDRFQGNSIGLNVSLKF
jgi:hypothetical protein